MDYESIGKEAKSFGIDKLSELTGISRSNIYSIISEEVNPKITTLEKLLIPLGYSLFVQKNLDTPKKNKNLNKEDLYEQLSFYGAPLTSNQSIGFIARPLTEVFLAALESGRRDTTINSILPAFIYKNWENFNWRDLIVYSNDKRYLGYLLNIVFHITNDLKVASILSKVFSEVKLKKKERLIKRKNVAGVVQLKLFEATDNKIADTWLFQTTDSLKDIQERFLKWQNL